MFTKTEYTSAIPPTTRSLANICGVRARDSIPTTSQANASVT
jgi:hypothetical protein